MSREHLYEGTELSYLRHLPRDVESRETLIQVADQEVDLLREIRTLRDQIEACERQLARVRTQGHARSEDVDAALVDAAVEADDAYRGL